MDYHLVKFIDDGILYVCENKRLDKGKGNTNRMVRYKHYGSFKANILHSGGKQAMMEKMKLLIAESICENIHTNSKQYEDIPEDAVSIPRIAENSEKLQESVQECNDYFVLEDVSLPNVVNELRENEIDSLYFMAHHEDFSQDNQIQTQGIIKKCTRSLNFTMSENEHIGESITDVDVPIALEENIQVETEHPNLLTDTLTVEKDITLSEDILVGEVSSVASTDSTYSPQSSSSDSNHSILSLKNLRVKKALDFNTFSNENGKGHTSDLNKNIPNIDATDNVEVNNLTLLQNVPTCTGSLNINVESGHVQMSLENTLHAYRGKSLEELRLLGDKEEVRDLSDSDCCTDDNVDSVTTKTSDEISETEGIINNTPSKLSSLSNTLRSPTKRTPKKLRRYNNLNIKTPLKSPVRRNVAFRNRWSQEEVNILKEEFQTNLQNCTLPPISSCLAVLRRNANVFKSRTKYHIYAWINNKNKQTRRKKT